MKTAFAVVLVLAAAALAVAGCTPQGRVSSPGNATRGADYGGAGNGEGGGGGGMGGR
jgi:hypothetical protein